MATWTGTGAGEGLSDEALEPGQPWTSIKALSVRDNPIAIAEGASGAPRILNSAHPNGEIGAEKLQSGDTERDWVLERTAGASVGVVGSYAFLEHSVSGSAVYASPGDTKPGSELDYAGADIEGGTNAGTSSGPPGTWRCMGHMQNTDATAKRIATVWLRIS